MMGSAHRLTLQTPPSAQAMAPGEVVHLKTAVFAKVLLFISVHSNGCRPTSGETRASIPLACLSCKRMAARLLVVFMLDLRCDDLAASETARVFSGSPASRCGKAQS